MDNIQKLIVGVLGVSGMLAMVVPSNIDVSPKPAAEALPVAVAVAEPAGGDDGSGEEVVEESDFNDEDVFMTGEPAINGSPIQGQTSGDPDGQQQQANQYVPPPIDYGGQANLIPSYSVPLPQPMPQPQPQPLN